MSTLSSRPRFDWHHELALALLPTIVMLLVLWFGQEFSRQRLLFASLASSAFLIYLDPEHPMNGVRTVILAQGCAALLGYGAEWALGAGYAAEALAMVATIVVMIALSAMHPPAVSTSLTFAFRAAPASSLSLFGMSVGLIAMLVLLQRASLWLVARYRRGQPHGA